MNKTEAAFDRHLAELKLAGEVVWYRFEAITLKLADDCRLTVDFFVMRANGELQAYDTKGAPEVVTDDAKVKMRMAATAFPWPFFYAYPKQGGGWDIREV